MSFWKDLFLPHFVHYPLCLFHYCLSIKNVVKFDFFYFLYCVASVFVFFQHFSILCKWNLSFAHLFKVLTLNFLKCWQWWPPFSPQGQLRCFWPSKRSLQARGSMRISIWKPSLALEPSLQGVFLVMMRRVWIDMRSGSFIFSSFLLELWLSSLQTISRYWTSLEVRVIQKRWTGALLLGTML